MPLLRSLANLSSVRFRRKSGWKHDDGLGTGLPGRNTKCRKVNKPDGTITGSTKRLASRYYQLKAGHCCTEQYLRSAKVRPTAQCWWCQCPSQTRDHLFMVCFEWRMQRKILSEQWASGDDGPETTRPGMAAA